jgi:hypothetical protein
MSEIVTTADVRLKSSSFYRAIMLELERKRQAMGMSMESLSEIVGAERSWSKMLYPDTPSGRQAGWDKLQRAIDALFCDGFDVIVRAGATRTDTTPGTKRLIRQSAAHFDRRTQRDLMRDLSKLAILGRKKIPRWKLARIRRKAGKASGKRRRELADERSNTPRCVQGQNGRAECTQSATRG